jgi:hypothetical protein
MSTADSSSLLFNQQTIASSSLDDYFTFLRDVQLFEKLSSLLLLGEFQIHHLLFIVNFLGPKTCCIKEPITYELLSHIVERSSRFVSLIKSLRI